MSFGFEITCLLWLCAQDPSKANPDFTSFIGSDACRLELRGTDAGFGLALDRKRGVELETRRSERKAGTLGHSVCEQWRSLRDRPRHRGGSLSVALRSTAVNLVHLSRTTRTHRPCVSLPRFVRLTPC
jgi:hypothetical protein